MESHLFPSMVFSPPDTVHWIVDTIQYSNIIGDSESELTSDGGIGRHTGFKVVEYAIL